MMTRTMRGFVAQAVAAAAATWAMVTPALAGAPAYEELQDLDQAAAFFNLPLQNHHNPETIRLDIANTANPCDPTSLSIDYQLLPLGANYLGKGTLFLPSGSIIEALWTITCVFRDDDGDLLFEPGNISPVRYDQFEKMKPGMWVVLDILKINDEDVHMGIEANFEQGSDYVKWHFADVYGPEGVDGEEVKMVTYIHDEAGETDWIAPWESEAAELKWEPRPVTWYDDNDDYEDDAAPESQQEEDEVDSSQQTVREKCTDFDCIMGQIKESMTIEEFKQIDAQVEDLVKETLAKHNKKQKPLSAPKFHDDNAVFTVEDVEQMKPISATDNSASPSETQDAPTRTPTNIFLAALPPQDQDLLLTLFLAGTAFLLFTLLSLFIFKSHSEPPTVQRLPLHRRETREERLARVSNRRKAFTSFFGRIFCGLFSVQEKTTAEQEPQGRDCRGQRGEGTMEQEIQGFREAASMVESMIAAEEGRNQPPSQDQMAEVEQTPPPPSYENDRADAGMVADGFRYMRVGGEEGGNEGSDRLGYGNKD